MTQRRLAAATLIAVLVVLAGCASAPTGGQLPEPPGAAPGQDGATAPDASGPGSDYTRLYEGTIDSVVTLRVATEEGVVGGSGFVYDRRGHVVTNAHVVGDSETVEVRFRNGEWHTGTVVGTDPYTDLAVVRVARPPASAEPLPIAEGTPRPGERVVALGNPFGLEGSITSGIVSGVNRTMPTENGFSIPDVVQTDAPINPGNSGGPLVSVDGAVVGVNTAGIRAAQAENVGFAVSAAVVERVVPALVATGRYEHSFVGIFTLEVTPTIAEANGLAEPRGLLVVGIPNGGPADGVLQPTSSNATVDGGTVPTDGDVIVAVDGRPIDTHQALSRYLALHTSPGQTISITVLREGERRTVELELGSRPPPT